MVAVEIMPATERPTQRIYTFLMRKTCRNGANFDTGACVLPLPAETQRDEFICYGLTSAETRSIKIPPLADFDLGFSRITR
jgi:hypothetical protein